MSETKETMQGVVASVTEKSSNQKTITWSIVFQDGRSEEKCVFYRDSGVTPTPGSLLCFRKGQWNSWLYDKQATEAARGGGGGSSSSDNASASGAAQSAGKSDNSGYWAGKTDYEQNVRDPKIEFQTYLRMVLDTYNAALPHLEQPPTNVEEVNAMIDDAMIKTQAIFDSRNKKG